MEAERLGRRWRRSHPIAPINAMCGICCTPGSLVQARLDRQVEQLQQQIPVVARQAARLAAGKRPRGKHPRSDVAAHAALVAQAQYACEGLRYLSGELRRRLRVVVLTAQGVMPSSVRQGELEARLSLLDELSQVAPEAMQHELARLVTLLGAALPQLVLFVPGLDALQERACGQCACRLATDRCPSADRVGGGRAGQQCRRELAQCLASVLGGASQPVERDGGAVGGLAQSSGGPARAASGTKPAHA